MKKTVLILVLCTAYTALQCRVLLPLVNYWINAELYLERCENKDKPELECDGACQVEKEIVQTVSEEQSPENNTNSHSQRTNSSENLEQLYLLIESLHVESPEAAIKLFFAELPANLLFGVGRVPFQPPRA